MGHRFEDGFRGRTAVVTGGGTGMGRELVVQLAAGGCDVATCDVIEENLAETARLAASAPGAGRVLTFRADVSDEARMAEFRDAVAEWSGVVHLLFNNAGIGGGGSFVEGSREDWEKTFAVCWGGVYIGCRVFLPLLSAADAAHIVNTSSVNGLWASLGPVTSHTAYSAAKFAVRGFTEALITDLRLCAPHIHASVVMPGHIGTSIVTNSGRILGRDPGELSDEDISRARERLSRVLGVDLAGMSDDEIRAVRADRARGFLEDAPTTAAEASARILAGVRADEWRILVGEDAVILDEVLRADPVGAYEPAFVGRLHSRGAFGSLVPPVPVEENA